MSVPPFGSGSSSPTFQIVEFDITRRTWLRGNRSPRGGMEGGQGTLRKRVSGAAPEESKLVAFW